MKIQDSSLKCVSVVVKIASRCNLNCTYCYMYNLGDETYKNQPKFMSSGVTQALFERVKSHCLQHGLSEFTFILHGGEPMLAGQEYFRNFFEQAKNHLLPEVKPVFGMQTNGLLITHEWCDLLAEFDVGIGISLDGTPEANDLYRVDHAGRGSYTRIVKGLKTAQQHPFFQKRGLGALCVVNINSDPLACYEHFKELEIPNISFLIPDHNFDNPPLPPLSGPFSQSETPYADWLIAIFDQWVNEKGKKPAIAMFERIMEQILGGARSNDSMGSNRNEILVIETNGSIESVDVLKICGDGFTKGEANVLTHELDEAIQTDLAKVYHLSHEMLCAQCNGCPVSHLCGGGYIPHRYSSKNGFNNPSVYCLDLLKLITHIQNKILSLLPPEVITDSGVSILTYEEAKDIIQEELLTAVEPDYVEELVRFAR